mmetsp:Transcript_106655/g.340341  ORF Transcript_106655/g.340341 Transcript_106655/m.340341 type:complete len:254 (-) Transcript_106655:554-1315(-)
MLFFFRVRVLLPIFVVDGYFIVGHDQPCGGEPDHLGPPPRGGRTGPIDRGGVRDKAKPLFDLDFLHGRRVVSIVRLCPHARLPPPLRSPNRQGIRGCCFGRRARCIRTVVGPRLRGRGFLNRSRFRGCLAVVLRSRALALTLPFLLGGVGRCLRVGRRSLGARHVASGHIQQCLLCGSPRLRELHMQLPEQDLHTQSTNPTASWQPPHRAAKLAHGLGPLPLGLHVDIQALDLCAQIQQQAHILFKLIVVDSR